LITRSLHRNTLHSDVRCVAALLCGLQLAVLMATIACAQNAADYATLVPIGNAYANGINTVSFRQNSLTSVQVGNDTYQFAAYYRNSGGGQRRVTIARRLLGSTDWDIFNLSGSAFGDPNSNATDTHNTISVGIDGDGYMHMSWGMHNNDLIYRKSDAPVLNSDPITFGTTNLPMTGNNENSVTYPQFYNLPDGDLLGFYRNGGSGNGNSYLNRYDTDTDTWSALQTPLFDGISSSVNAYFNSLAFDSQGVLHATWTDRSTPAFQTNHNIYYARSADQGATWTKMDGTPYTMPITESTAELVVPIPENSTLINQTSMAVDKNDHPVVATWWAPGTEQGDFTRQYMLSYYDGAAWQTSQISNRPVEPLQSDATVRDLGRPIVMVDDNNRTIVVMRYDQHSDVVTVGYSEDNQNWNLVDLTAEGLGDWEPTYDAALWQRENKLHLLYQPVGLGSTSSTISVLEWDEKAFFLDLAGPPLTLQVNRSTGQVAIANPDNDAVGLSAYSITSAGGQLAPTQWNSLADQSAAGWAESQALANGLSEASGGDAFTLGASGGTAPLGNPFAGQPIAFRVDAPADLVFQYTAEGHERTGSVEYTGESLNNLTLKVDPDTGLARLENTSPFPVSIDAYTVASTSNSLDPASWKSLDDQSAAGGQWYEANAGVGRVSELQASGSTLLEPGDSYEMGVLFSVGGQQDLVFDFLLAGDSVGLRGVVLYTPVRLPGDYNDNGIVDAADYTVWRNSLGQNGVGLAADGTGPRGIPDGLVDSLDYDFWKSHFGETIPNGSGAGANAAVPEPATGVMLVVGLLAKFFRRRSNLSLVRASHSSSAL
jgi:BNR repeat-containing family member/PEP-CTERM motif